MLSPLCLEYIYWINFIPCQYLKENQGHHGLKLSQSGQCKKIRRQTISRFFMKTGNCVDFLMKEILILCENHSWHLPCSWKISDKSVFVVSWPCAILQHLSLCVEVSIIACHLSPTRSSWCTFNYPLWSLPAENDIYLYQICEKKCP